MRFRLLIAPLLLAAPLVRGQPPAFTGGTSESFDTLAERAAEAWEKNRFAEAARLYGQAVGRNPDWDEGWWYLGTASYTAQRWDECRTAFRRFLELKPESGPGWALRGLCELETGDRAAARTSLEQALALGGNLNRELHRAAQWGLAQVLIKEGQFERAMEPLAWLARVEPDTPGLEVGIGLTFLRMPLRPSEVPENRRDLVSKAGRAGFLSLATREQEAEAAYVELVEAYPGEPWVHYAYGAFLKKIDSERALAEFRLELKVQPRNVFALLEIAFDLLVRADYEGAHETARTATRLAPDLFAARHALGRSLVGLGRLEEGIAELETAARLAPDVPEMHFALERAYVLAGRTEDAAGARARFAELRRRQEGREPPTPTSVPEAREP